MTNNKRIKSFTKEQEQKIRSDYLITPIKALAKELDVHPGRIIRFLKRNNLKIPKEVLKKRQLNSRLKKGHIPHNKGKKQKDYMSAEAIERTKKTRFKKGDAPHNTNPKGDGAITRRFHKGYYYKYIRVSLGSWRLYHHVLWEENHGKIPNKHIVSFKNGDTQDVRLDNLELISKIENMYKNSKHNYPKEIIPSLVLTRKITNKINDLQND